MEEDEGKCLLQPLNPISLCFSHSKAWLDSGCGGGGLCPFVFHPS